MTAAFRALVLLPSLAAALPAADVPFDVHATDDQRSHIAHVNTHGGSGAPTTDAISSATAKFAGTSYVQQPSVVAPNGTLKPEAEEHIAASPSGTLVAAVSDFAANRAGWVGYNTSRYSVSFDGGATWSSSYVDMETVGAQTLLKTSDGRDWEFNSDPVVAFDANGTAYVADLYLNNSNSANGIYVSVIPAGTTRASATNAVVVNDVGSPNDEDKEWIAVDRTTTPNTIYVAWTRFIGNSDQIMIASSTDGGASFTVNATPVSPSSQNGAVQGPQVAIGPGGEVYVAWHVAYVGNRGRIWLAKSTNHGASFGAAAAVTPLFYELTFNSSYRKNSFPALAVSPTDGRVHLLYADMPSKSLGAEVEYCVSTNGGASFSTPLALNDKATGQQFMPAIAVDAAGGVHASWFDTRNASNASGYDIYAARSLDGGATWGANLRVTPGPGVISAGNASFIGDYAGICAGPLDANGHASAHPVWTNGGFNNGTLQTATLAPGN